MESTKLFRSDPLRTNGFSPSPQKQQTLEEPLQGAERSHENSALSISFVAKGFFFFCGFRYEQNNDRVRQGDGQRLLIPLIPVKKW